MRVLHNTSKRLLSVLLIIAMLFSAFPFVALAEETDSSFVTEGSFQFASKEYFNKQLHDTFTFREDCFMRSSYLGCCHLVELSAQVAISSDGWYGPEEDMYEVDHSDHGHNLKNMLKEMGFENISLNTYYTSETLDDSAACGLGTKKINAFGKEYTLLAVIPRGDGYKREWAGNMNVGAGDYHIGFKDARDEILRFVKNYIEENNITGDLKIWTVGHSRGAALANMLGGFFAGTGNDYFGEDVSISPEDVYCYTFATPRTIKAGVSKDELFSVSGPRGGRYEALDTPGEAWTYAAGGTVDPEAVEYSGIKNYPLTYDLIASLPPSYWGFTYFGSVLPVDAGGCVGAEDMLAELANISPYAYEKFLSGGDYRNFKWKTFDFPSLSIVNDENAVDTESVETFMSQRVQGLIKTVPDNQSYSDEGYQDTLNAVAGLYGLLHASFTGGIEINVQDYIKPLAFIYLSYAADRLIEEGRAESEVQGIAVALADLITFVAGEPVNANETTVDELFYILSKYISDHEGEPVYETAFSSISGIIPDEYKLLISGAFGEFYPSDDEDYMPTLEESLAAFIKACAYGADPKSGMGSTPNLSDPKEVRKTLYSLLTLASFFMENAPDFAKLIGMTDFAIDGSATLSDFTSGVLELLMTEKDEEGNIVDTYSSINDAADKNLVKALDMFLGDTIENTKSIYGEQYYLDTMDYLNQAKQNAPLLRELATYFLFYSEGESFSTASSLRNALSLAGNLWIIPISHFNEVYIAWTRAARKSECLNCNHYIEFKEAVPATCKNAGEKAHWILHDDGERYFLDRTLSEEISKEEIVTDKTPHVSGDSIKENITPATRTNAGYYDMVTYCKICGEELSRRRVIIPAEESEDKPTPENPTPENPTPDPENPTPVNPTPDPDKPIPENPTPINPTPENPTPINPTPENPTPVKPTPGTIDDDNSNSGNSSQGSSEKGTNTFETKDNKDTKDTKKDQSLAARTGDTENIEGWTLLLITSIVCLMVLSAIWWVMSFRSLKARNRRL